MLNGLKYRLLFQVYYIGAAVDLTRDGAVNDRSGKQSCAGLVYSLVPVFPDLETDGSRSVVAAYILVQVGSKPLRDIVAPGTE